MTPERWEQVERLYHRALESPAAERLGVLDDLCAGDDELRQEVESLLALGGATGFLEIPGLAAADGAAGTERAPLEGRRLGPYVVHSSLGVGGMGEVYRAKDEQLGREVAIKVLPAVFAADPERLRRLEGEARVLAALNHPFIASIYGLVQAEGVHGLVLELVEGPTLADRLDEVGGRGLPIEEALAIARQIADAVDAAHEKGIVHRDLKPANIKLTGAGVVKVLDFGLAKVVVAAPPPSSSSPTLRRGDTEEGTVLGTAAYMSPEQARGKAVDKRMDIWAFGCVLFEMLTGRPPFTGETPADTLAGIVEREPDWRTLPDATPRPVRRLLARCLQKDPRTRLRDIGDAQADLAGAGEDEAPRGLRTAGTAGALSIGAVIAAVAIAIGAWLRPRPPAEVPRPPVRFSVPPPEGGAFVADFGTTTVAFSPDGSQLAYIGGARGGVRRIWLRPLSAGDARPLAGTDDARSLFWSPDSRSLAFFAGDKLKRLDLPDGPSVPVCEVPDVIGLSGTWGTAGEILFASVEGDAIRRVSTAGGTASEAVVADRAGDRVNWPWFLPDGRRFLYLTRLREGGGRLTLGELGRPARAVLPAVSAVQWVDPDVLVFAREGVLVGQRFDLATEQVLGEPFAIAEPVAYFLSSGWALFATSRNGNVAYQAHVDRSRLVWTDRRGAHLGDISAPGGYQGVRISPDGRSLLFGRARTALGTYDLWTLDITRGVETRLTSDPGSENLGVWLPDGRGVVFVADRGGLPHLFRKDLRTGVEDELTPMGRRQMSADVSPDGTTLAYGERTSRGNFDILSLSLDGRGAPAPLRGTRFDERDLRFSPDGRAVVFLSDESGQSEVYAAPFPAMVPAVRVSTGGGRQPQWSGTGRELFYIGSERQLVSVPVRTQPSLEVGTPGPLFVLPERPPWGDFAVSPDGTRFLSVVHDVRGSEQPLTVVLDWPAGLPQSLRR
jgi:Tol biopolymer transport system component